MGGHHLHHPHLARPVLASGTTGDTVRLQVHVPKGHLLPLDAELAYAACGGMEMGVTWRSASHPGAPQKLITHP